MDGWMDGWEKKGWDRIDRIDKIDKINKIDKKDRCT